MKLTIFILTIAIVQVSASSFAQHISLSEKNTPISVVLKKIQQQSGYDIFYKNKLIKDSKINLDLQDVSIETALKAVLDHQDLEFSIEDKLITIQLKEKTFLERLANRWANIDVSGRIVDAEGNGIPGATVNVKGSSKSAITGKNGIFNLNNVDEDAVLVISYIGYIKKEINASKNLGDVVLEQSLSKLDEVQVIAYGTTTQRLSTGNVTTIKADVIEKQPVNNPLLALQGRVPGLFIEQATGLAGSGVKVRVQGTNSIDNGNEPFFVIDGVPFISQLPSGGNNILNGASTMFGNNGGSPLNFINPYDIESIDVLKDADATSIYGSRAANGAILITTKKGRDGNTRINLNMQTGIGQVTRSLNLMNSAQYLAMRKEAYLNDGIDINSSPNNTEFSKIYQYPELSGFWDSKRDIDWQKELLGETAHYTDMQTTVSGGTQSSTYLIGGNFHRETNVFPGYYSDIKGSAHFNISSSSLNRKFKIVFSGFYLLDNSHLPGVDITSIVLRLPSMSPSLRAPDGSLNWMPDTSGETTFGNNPLQNLINTYKNKTGNLVGNSVLSYEILKGITLSSSFGYSNLSSNAVYAQPQFQPEQQAFLAGWVTSFGNSATSSWSVDPVIRYLGNMRKSKIEILLGSTIQQRMSNSSSIDANGFSTIQVMEDIKSATTLTPTASIQEVYRYNAVFGRINYNWSDKYIINVGVRRDGSSRFGDENKFHSFWSIGTAWIFSKEKFIENNFAFLSFGKLRASYGTTGNDQIGEYKFLSLYKSTNYSVPYQGVNSYKPDGLSNSYLQWEETKKLQLGLDIGLLSDKILLGANYSLNKSSNQLLIQGLPIQTGFTSFPMNLPATVQNRGWELMLTSNQNVAGDFKWTSTVNLTFPKNKLLKFVDFNNSSYSSGYSIGESINVQHLYHFLGVDPLTGIYQVADRFGNPSKNPIPYYMPNTDATVLLNTDPQFYGGFQNSFSYKGFQLDIHIYFTKQSAQNNTFGNLFPSGFTTNQVPENQIMRWQKPGDVTSIQKYTTSFDLFFPLRNVQYYSDAGWSDASYVRLRNVSLSWQIPDHWRKDLHVNNCKFFMQGQNLMTFTSYTGLDPETKSSDTLPLLRILTFGVKLEL